MVSITQRSEPPATPFVLGLDLGQANDYTALSVGEVRMDATPFDLQIRHLHRFPLRLPYPTMVEETGVIVSELRKLGRVVMVIDHTGVGRPVVDLFRMAGLGITIWPVTIATSAMGQAKRDPETGNWTVPKKDLVAAIQTMAYADRLKVAGSLPYAPVLGQELLAFRMKYTAAANVTYEAWREGDHDDLVLSVAMTCWGAMRWANPGGLI